MLIKYSNKTHNNTQDKLVNNSGIIRSNNNNRSNSQAIIIHQWDLVNVLSVLNKLPINPSKLLLICCGQDIQLISSCLVCKITRQRRVVALGHKQLLLLLLPLATIKCQGDFQDRPSARRIQAICSRTRICSLRSNMAICRVAWAHNTSTMATCPTCRETCRPTKCQAT